MITPSHKHPTSEELRVLLEKTTPGPWMKGLGTLEEGRWYIMSEARHTKSLEHLPICHGTPEKYQRAEYPVPPEQVEANPLLIVLAPELAHEVLERRAAFGELVEALRSVLATSEAVLIQAKEPYTLEQGSWDAHAASLVPLIAAEQDAQDTARTLLTKYDPKP